MKLCDPCGGIVASAVVLIALVFIHVARLGSRAYLRLWSGAWLALAAGASVAASGLIGPVAGAMVAAAAKILFAAAFAAGALAYGAREERGRIAPPLLAGAILAAIIAAAIVPALPPLVGATTGAAVALAALALFARHRRGSTCALAVGGIVLAAAETAVALGTLETEAVLLAHVLLAAVMLGCACEEQREEAVATIAEVERLAWHDPLTGLPNRRLFLDRAAMALARARRAGTHVGVVFIDLDRFKLVNDTMGHHVGDEVLRRFGKRLREHVREGDTVARMGGDEFTLLMPDVRDPADFPAIAAKLLAKLRAPLELPGQSVYATASVGISVYPDLGSDIEVLLRNADAAMYRAKQRGGDNFQLYAPSIENVDAAEQAELEVRLRRAVARQEFILYYQPRVDPGTGRAVACEALIRWNEPERGLLLPADFIRAAEASGIIIPIGEWVLRTACRQVKQWHAEGLSDLRVSVNLSARQFKQHDLTETIREALTGAGIEPRFLELEVDESGVMHDAEASMRILQRLRALGVHVLISGFGAGYSSISYLQRFPIDGVKLDRRFLEGGRGDDDRALAAAALGMARALRLKVIGEGVETVEAAEFVRAHACAGMQGFLVSAPVPADECTRFILPPSDAHRRAATLRMRRHATSSSGVVVS